MATTTTKSIGESRWAYESAIVHSLRENYYGVATMEWLVQKLSEAYNIISPIVEYGQETRRRRASYWPGQNRMRFNSSGCCIATALHEFAHHLQYSQDGYAAKHGRRFKAAHDLVVRDFIVGNLGGINKAKLEIVEGLNFYWENYPATYDKFWKEHMPSEELIYLLDKHFKTGDEKSAVATSLMTSRR